MLYYTLGELDRLGRPSRSLGDLRNNRRWRRLAGQRPYAPALLASNRSLDPNFRRQTHRETDKDSRLKVEGNKQGERT